MTGVFVGGIVDGPPLFGCPLEVGRGMCDSSSMPNFHQQIKIRRVPGRVGRRRTGQRLIYPANLRWDHLRGALTWRTVESDLVLDRTWEVPARADRTYRSASDLVPFG